ncbi:hypothetical protein QTO31_17710 [Chloroflexus sp. MS-CIW-1]|jgi:hypothetical protein|uniref:hypothetical protein n=1 Tax=unclassified Chloroflexus TaxID=2633855 RepID=UPI0004DF9530|nr:MULTISPECIES: hypothetical protein [unclassified Chloroflexus]MDN5273807.1 hypothetical protein [Chloroflexus sp. MS-CIW-1]
MATRSRSQHPSTSTTAFSAIPADEAGARRQLPFLMWYDDNPKVPINRKIAAAIEAYKSRFPGVQPTLVLVNEAELTTVEGVTVRAMPTVSRNTYWVGQK